MPNIPDMIPLHCLENNPKSSAIPNNNIVNDLEYSHVAMYTLEVLQNCFMQCKPLLFSLGEIDPFDSHLMTFNLNEARPWMSYSMAF